MKRCFLTAKRVFSLRGPIRKINIEKKDKIVLYTALNFSLKGIFILSSQLPVRRGQ